MTSPERLAVAVEEAVRALETRAKLARVTNPDEFAREFIDALRRQGWRPFAPVTALPGDHARPAAPPSELLSETRALIRAARPQESTDA
jgi:hypothetical protein